MQHPDFDAIHLVHRHFKQKIGLTFQDWFLSEHKRLKQGPDFQLGPKSFGERALRNNCLSYLVASKTKEGMDTLEKHFFEAENMTEEVCGLQQYILSGVSLGHKSIQHFYQKWGHDSLVMLKWFGSLSAFSPKEEVLDRLMKLENDPLFLKDIPNYLRALYLQFAQTNLNAFHDSSGSGYRFLAQRIRHIDGLNPQFASRGASAYSMINKLDDSRKHQMKMALTSIMEGKPSRDTFEVISKYLSQ